MASGKGWRFWYLEIAKLPEVAKRDLNVQRAYNRREVSELISSVGERV